MSLADPPSGGAGRQVLLSIVVAVKDEDAALGETLNSIERCFSAGGVEVVVKRLASPSRALCRMLGKVRVVNVLGPDAGIYDAWNQALEHASGRFVMFLGAGDQLSLVGSSSGLELLDALSRVSSSSLIVASPQGAPRLDPWESQKAVEAKLLFLEKQFLFSHPEVMHSIKDIRNVGGFSSQYKVIGDYDMLLKLKRQNKYRKAIIHLGNYIVVSRVPGGISEKPESRLEILKEMFLMRLRHRLWPVSKYMLILTARTVVTAFNSRRASDE